MHVRVPLEELGEMSRTPFTLIEGLAIVQDIVLGSVGERMRVGLLSGRGFRADGLLETCLKLQEW